MLEINFTAQQLNSIYKNRNNPAEINTGNQLFVYLTKHKTFHFQISLGLYNLHFYYLLPFTKITLSVTEQAEASRMSSPLVKYF